MLQAPSSSVRPDFARVISRKFDRGHFLVIGPEVEKLERQFGEAGREAIVSDTCADLTARLLQNGSAPSFETAIWFYPPEKTEDDCIVEELSRRANDIVLIPGVGADLVRRRPQLVERFCRFGLLPDYQCDLGELDLGALRVRRQPSETVDVLVPAAEAAFSRLNKQMSGFQQVLRTRMSELEAADRHIAKLEEKVLKLKEAKDQLKVLREEKQALRKSPERRVGQVLLAPYRLPQKLFREVRKQMRQRSGLAVQHGSSATEYEAWLRRHRVTHQQLAAIREEAQSFLYQPLVSIITPVFDTCVPWLEEAVGSVLAQAYEKWELLLINDASTDPETLAALSRIFDSDPRIHLIQRETRGGISVASNSGIAQALGEWLAIFDHDDILEPDALFHVVKVLQERPDADLIYSDEDKLTEDGFDVPLLKPDWSPDFFLSYNYICHFTAIRRAVVEKAGGFRSEYDGAQDYDLFLRVTEHTNRIHHIPRVLYHWRRSDSSLADNVRRKPRALEAGRRAIEEHLGRRGENSHVVVDWNTHAYWVKRQIPEGKKISIIIPTRDRLDLLSRCIESLTTKTSYQNYEILIVDNESLSNQAQLFFAETKHRVLHFSGPFNFSALNNFAVSQTQSPWLLFLNNDIEVIHSDWLDLMVEHIQRPEVGAVGPRLLHPNDTVQHAGVVLGVGRIAAHAFRGFPAEDLGVCRQLQVIRNYSCVTGACLLTRRDVFTEVGGFDEERLPVTFSDVDLCLKMRRAGYLIVYTPFAKLYHHESASRRRTTVEALESDVIRERWPDLLKCDPYYNPNLSRKRADFSLGN